MDRITAVIDTNVIVAAIRSSVGASYALLASLGDKEPPFRPVVSVPLVLEYEDAMLRSIESSSLTEGDVGDILDFLCSIAIHQEIFYLWRPLLRDPGDDLVLEVAVAASVDYLVTFNQRDFAGSESVGVNLITPAQLVEKLGILK